MALDVSNSPFSYPREMASPAIPGKERLQNYNTYGMDRTSGTHGQ